jgi:diaminopimelate decarboxylase
MTTVRSFEDVTDFSADAGARLATDVRLDEAIALRRCAVYRNAFRGAAVAYPAEAMRLEAIARWMRRQGVTVDVSNVDDLDWTAIAGVHPSHIVMHGFDEVSGPIALGYGVARVIVDSAEQMDIVRASATRARGVLLDVTDAGPDHGMIADRRVAIDGLHYDADGADLPGLSEIVFGMIVEMALISRKQAAILSRLSIGDLDLSEWDDDPRSLRRVGQLIDEVVEDACVRVHFPRPALTLSPRPSTLLPAA